MGVFSLSTACDLRSSRVLQAGVLEDISKQMGLWAQLRHIAGELRAIRGGGAARKASALRAMLRCAGRPPSLNNAARPCLQGSLCQCDAARCSPVL
jgi:hypothetical protein